MFGLSVSAMTAIQPSPQSGTEMRFDNIDGICSPLLLMCWMF